MEYTPEQIQIAIKNMPSYVVEAFDVVDIDSTLEKIGKEQTLHVDILGQIEGMISLVFAGLEKAEDFGDFIRKDLGIAGEAGEGLIAAINERIFQPIREKIHEYQEEQREAQEEATTETDPVASPETIETGENEILKKAGVEVSEAPVETDPQKESGMNLNRSEMLSGLENPPETKIYKLNTSKETALPAPTTQIAPLSPELPPHTEVTAPTATPPAEPHTLPIHRSADLDLVRSKLEAPQASPKTTTDHSLQNITPQSAPAKKIDPYREAI